MADREQNPAILHTGVDRGCEDGIEDHEFLRGRQYALGSRLAQALGMFGSGFPFNEYCINEHVYRMRARDEVLSQEFLYFWVSSDATIAEMRERGTGVAVPGLNSTNVKALPVLIPPRNVVQRFADTAGNIVEKIFTNSNQSRALASVRDALLPKLLSGEIRVKA